MNGYEIAFICLGVILALGGISRREVIKVDPNVQMFTVPPNESGSVWVLQVILLSLAFGKGGDAEFWFVAFAAWSWSWLILMGLFGFKGYQANTSVNSKLSGSMGLFFLAILGCAIGSAVQYANDDPLDDRSLCIFAFVTTFLPMLGAMSAGGASNTATPPYQSG